MESFRQIKNNNVDLISNNDPLDKNRLLIEDLWESVLREECPCLLYTSPSPRDPVSSRMPSSA